MRFIAPVVLATNAASTIKNKKGQPSDVPIKQALQIKLIQQYENEQESTCNG